MKRTGFIGWRGMVGSVLMDRMLAEKDFNHLEPLFFTTSQVGQPGPDIGIDLPPLKDAYDVQELKKLDIIVTCQGGDYTKKMFPKLMEAGWKGYWIDAASALRMDKDSVIVLDPVNRQVIDQALGKGIKKFVGGNCTVSLMLMAIGVLFQEDLIEWMSTMTYQAASGAGAKNMRELVAQMASIGQVAGDILNTPESAIRDLDRRVADCMRSNRFPIECFGAPLAGSVLPWIDTPMETGQTREEWKGFAETNKILQKKPPVPIDGICVRVGAMRCHSQALTIKLNRDVPVDEIEDMIRISNEWVEVIPNDRAETVKRLTPTAVTGTLNVPIGRIHKLNIGPEYLTAFTVGDQLLWGAAEPIRRILRIVLDYLG